MFARTTLCCATASILAAISGCAADESVPTEIEVAEIQEALSQPNGGFDRSDEPANADDAAEGEDANLVDANADSPEAETLAKNSEAVSYRVLVLWGHLPQYRDFEHGGAAPDPIDWSGSISVDEGAIGVKRKVKWDTRDELDPKASKNEVTFTSHTRPMVDGLLLHVVLPKGTSKQVHIKTAALTTDIDLAGIDTASTGAIGLKDGRNGLAYAAFRDVPDCKQGILFGKFIQAGREAGELRGRVFSGSGEKLGHTRGIWGERPKDGRSVFFGKYVNDEGKFGGLFGGQYEDGEMRGRWGSVKTDNAGTLEGRYFDGLDAKGHRKGAYLGAFSEGCKP
jgi:hypothetical protein